MPGIQAALLAIKIAQRVELKTTAIDRALHLLHQAQTICPSLPDARSNDRPFHEQQLVALVITCIYMAGKLENCFRTLRNLLQVATSLYQDVMKFNTTASSVDANNQFMNRWRNEVSLWERFLLLRLSNLGSLRQPTCTQITYRMLAKCELAGTGFGVGGAVSNSQQKDMMSIWDHAMQLCLMVETFTSGRPCPGSCTSKLHNGCLCAPVKAVLTFSLLAASHALPGRRVPQLTYKGRPLSNQLTTIVELLTDSICLPTQPGDGKGASSARWIYLALPVFEKYFMEQAVEGPIAFFHDVHTKIRQTTLKYIENGQIQQASTLSQQAPVPVKRVSSGQISSGPPAKRTNL